MNPSQGFSNEDDLKQIDIVKIYSDKTCLIIDDFPEIRGALSRSIKSFGAKAVETAANGEEAIKLCQMKKFDIVLCDYNLGAGKDGQQILEEVRFLRVLLMTSLFVMITGESSREMVLGALECQPDDYITKPYTQASLRLRLNKAIVRHQALLHIKKSISNGDYRRALEQCNEMIVAGSRYAMDCLKMKGQLHFLLKQLNEAATVYQSILGKKPVVWAKLGMGRTLLQQGKLDSAEEMLNSVLDEDERYIEAHDLLSEVYSQKKDTIAAQQSIENATKISPKSVLRHRKLAQLAELNNDDDTALKSHQQAIKWGTNSCHESEQDYFNYARKVGEVVQGDKSTEGKAMVQQAKRLLDRSRKRYSQKPDAAVQAQLVETQLHISQGDEANAQKSSLKAKKMYDDLGVPQIETSLELARTLHAQKEESKARELLLSLAARHEGNKDILQIIDSITGEAISEEGKSVAAGLTRSGISEYENKNYADAIQVFNEALFIYPKHIGLNLNLIQVLIADTAQTGFNAKHEAACKRGLRSIGKIDNNHPQAKRYNFIVKQIEKYYPVILADL